MANCIGRLGWFKKTHLVTLITADKRRPYVCTYIHSIASKSKKSTNK
jgi:hypothetical protein